MVWPAGGFVHCGGPLIAPPPGLDTMDGAPAAASTGRGARRSEHRQRQPGRDRHGLRLRRGGRRIGRQRARGAPERGSRGDGGAGRGRAARPQRAHPLPGRPRTARTHPRRELGLPHRAPARPERPRGLVAARQGAGRLELGQRHGLHPRPPCRLRPLGRARQPRMVLRRGPALLPPRRAQRAHPRRVPRQRRPAQRDGPAQPQPAPARLHRGRPSGGPPGHGRLQRRRAGGRRPLPGHPPQRRALQRRQGLSHAQPGPAEPHGDHRRAHHARALRRPPRHRDRVPSRRHAAAAGLAARGASRGRRAS